ncbi:hypothetical protein [Breoghania sp.]|uniref:hypothetical protein n=1 Tax=Breoghania sp. TaxID=2065378 RepID=UPI002602159D|nr:hypothetical protein [Breoghania sp.]MDJ0933554.1 hypothetical protein [Breoghania sp.]
MADTEEAAEEIGRIAERREKPVFTFFQWRLLPAFRTLRDLARSGELGPLLHIEAVFRHPFLADNATS